MKISYRSYPHPVLSYFSDDLVKCAFQATVTVETTRTFFRLNVSAVLSNRDLTSLIEAGHAAYAVHIECGATRYRAMKASPNASFMFDIPVSVVQGNVDVCVLVLASCELRGYKNANFHGDYGDRSFDIDKGDVLAVAEDRSFLADTDRDQLRKIPSIFEVIQTTDPDADALDLDLTGNKITIRLRPEDYMRYVHLVAASHLSSILASVIAMPVLVNVITDIAESQDPDQDFGAYRWYRVLKQRLDAMGIDLASSETSAAAVSQRLLESPLTPALRDIEAIAQEE